jgi:type IV pilus assembly protein PilM
MAKETLTIYIDDSAIRLLIAKGRSVQSWVDMPLEPGLVMDGVILDQDAVAAKLEELWQTTAGKRKISYMVTASGEMEEMISVTKPGKVIAGISGINCLHRLLTLPELPKDLLPEAVKREAGRVLGVPLAELYLFWQLLPSVRGELLIYLVALPRDTVDSLVSTLRKAGFKPYIMGLKPLAIARTIAEPNAIVVDVQSDSVDIVVMIDRIPQVVRTIPLPGEASLEDRIPVIGEELSRAIFFYNSSHMDKPIEADVPLLVSGELAEREDMWSHLLEERERPVQVLPSPMEAVEGFPHSRYLTNIGLALKEVLAEEKEAIPYSLVNFNALPEVYLPRRRPLSEVIYIAGIIIGIALIAWLAVSNFTISGRIDDRRSELAWINAETNRIVASYQDQLRVIDQDIAALEVSISLIQADIDSINVEINDLDQEIAGLELTALGFADLRDEVNGDLDVIINHGMPVTLASVSDSIDSITVTGSAAHEDYIFAYADYLRASEREDGSKRFSLVVVTHIEGGVSFTLQLVK